MPIDLASPFWGSLIGGLIVFFVSIGVIGIIKFTQMSIANKFIIDRTLRLDADIELLQKQHKEETAANIKGFREEKTKAIEQAINIYSDKFHKLLNEYKHDRPPQSGAADYLRDLYVYGESKKPKGNS